MGFFKSSFGKKGASTQQTAQPDAVAQRRRQIFPAELFEGERGEYLRDLGYEPDSPSNQMPTQETADAKFDEQYAIQRALLDQINAQLPEGTEVCAYAMLP